MSKDHLSSRYGKSFFETVLDSGINTNEKLESFKAEFLNVKNSFSKEFIDFLCNPVFDLDEKQSVLSECLGKMKTNSLLTQFLNLVLNLNHFSMIHEVYESFEHAFFDHRNEVKAFVESARPLSAVEAKEVQMVLEKKFGKNILIDSKVNPSLIGGIKARVKSVVFDASVEGYLNQLEREFSL